MDRKRGQYNSNILRLILLIYYPSMAFFPKQQVSIGMSIKPHKYSTPLHGFQRKNKIVNRFLWVRCSQTDSQQRFEQRMKTTVSTIRTDLRKTTIESIYIYT